MSFTKGVRGALAKATIAASTLTGCARNYDASYVDLVNVHNPNAVSTNKIEITFPYALVSDPEKKIIDLTNAEQVAEALEIKLDGKPDQLLYTIEVMSKVDPDSDHKITRSIPVTVKTIKEGADIINNAENALISEPTKAIAPDRVKSGQAEKLR